MKFMSYEQKVKQHLNIIFSSDHESLRSSRRLFMNNDTGLKINGILVAGEKWFVNFFIITMAFNFLTSPFPSPL